MLRWNIVINSKDGEGRWVDEPSVQVDARDFSTAWLIGLEIAASRYRESKVSHVSVASELVTSGMLEPIFDRDPGDETTG